MIQHGRGDVVAPEAVPVVEEERARQFKFLRPRDPREDALVAPRLHPDGDRQPDLPALDHHIAVLIPDRTDIRLRNAGIEIRHDGRERRGPADLHGGDGGGEHLVAGGVGGLGRVERMNEPDAAPVPEL